MRKKLFVILAELLCIHCMAQVSNDEILLLQRLDSVQRNSSVSKYFAELYFKTTVEAANFFLNRNKKEKDFIARLEIRFASFFFQAAEAYRIGLAIPIEWDSYFNNPDLLPIQYKLLGINAHINGDIWQALTSEFSLQEIQQNKESYLKFEKGLLKVYRDFYNESFEESGKIRLLSNITVRLDKLYGKLMLGKWRKRQIELAILFYTDKDKFNDRLKKLRLKMAHINRLVINNL